MSSGYAALVAAYYIGPAAPQPESDAEPAEKEPANIPIVVLGACLLWFGWFGVSISQMCH
jgi:ammonia channel protein AmtB